MAFYFCFYTLVEPSNSERLQKSSWPYAPCLSEIPWYLDQWAIYSRNAEMFHWLAYVLLAMYLKSSLYVHEALFMFTQNLYITNHPHVSYNVQNNTIFSNMNIYLNHLRILIEYRFWFSSSGVEANNTVLISSQVTLTLLVTEHTLNGKVIPSYSLD